MAKNICDFYKNNNFEDKAVGVITDKQNIFYYQPNNNNNKSIALTIENEIYNDKKDKLNPNNIHYYCYKKELIIDIPKNKKITKSQIAFLDNLLNQISQYNNKEKNKISIYTSINNTNNIEELKKEFHKITSNNIALEEEKIIGKTLDNNKIKSNILYYIGLDRCKKLSNIKESLKVCEIYSKDNYYNKFFAEIFPNYNKIEPLISEINILNPEEKVENISIDTIESILNYLIIKTKFKKKKELLSQKEIVIKNLEKLLKHSISQKKITDNKEKLIELYNRYTEIIKILEEKNIKIDEVSRQVETKKYHKNLASNRIDKDSKNIILKIINFKNNDKVKKIIEEYNNELNNLNSQKEKLTKDKEPEENEIKRIIDEFKKLSGLDRIPENFPNIKAKKIYIDEELIEKELTKLKQSKMKLEQELLDIQNIIINNIEKNIPKAKK